MSKNDSFYFDNFVNCIEVSKEAAVYLHGVLEKYNPAVLKEQVDEMHRIEHKGDQLKHLLMSEVARAFITPLEREDIVALSHKIDNVTDSVEDILINFYITNIRVVDDSAIKLSGLLIDCCKATSEMMSEFHNFKKSKKLPELLIEINRLEEQADNYYIEYMRRLHTENAEPLRIISWTGVYRYFERCFDACEDVADIVESIIIENT
jgi:hypothetical protein